MITLVILLAQEMQLIMGPIAPLALITARYAPQSLYAQLVKEGSYLLFPLLTATLLVLVGPTR